jgi:hypothetical protein
MPAKKKLTKAGKHERDPDDSVEAKKNAIHKMMYPKCKRNFENTSNFICHMKNIHKIKAGAPEMKASVANMGQYKGKPCIECRKMLTNLSMQKCTKEE